jgi:benzylsuccinate CoA-transferase BbsF subunit
MQIMADMGAEVIKVESIQVGRGTNTATTYPGLRRGFADLDPGKHPWNRAVYFNDGQVGMKSVTIDLTRPKGKELLRKLVLATDFVCENFSMGVMERLGLGYGVLKSWREDVIYLSLPAYGNTGPEAQYVAYGTNQSGMTGITHLTGYVDGDPHQVGINYADPTAGTHAVMAVMAAMLFRKKTGMGQLIDGSQLETGIRCLGEYVLDYQANGRLGTRMGNRHPSMAPCGIYRSAGPDKWIAISVSSDEEWKALCTTMGNPVWAKDEKFADHLSRLKNQDELDRHIEEWTSQIAPYEAMLTLQHAGVAAGVALTNAEVFEDWQNKARNFYQSVDHPEVGPRRHPSIGWIMSKTPRYIPRAAPCLGEHNEYVLGDMLGLSKKEIAELEADKIIGKAPLPEADPQLRPEPGLVRKKAEETPTN